MTKALELRRRLKARDLEAACALDVPWAEAWLLEEVDRIEKKRQAYERSGLAGVGSILGMGFLPKPKSKLAREAVRMVDEMRQVERYNSLIREIVDDLLNSDNRR